MCHFVSHKVELLDAQESLRNKMQGVRCNSAPPVSLLHAYCQNANILENRKECWVHANLVNQLIKCAQADTTQSKTQRRGDRSDPKVSSISLVGNSTDLTGSSLVLFSSRNIQFEERVLRHLLKSHKAA